MKGQGIDREPNVLQVYKDDLAKNSSESRIKNLGGFLPCPQSNGGLGQDRPWC
jgi:hypothetical protein